MSQNGNGYSQGYRDGYHEGYKSRSIGKLLLGLAIGAGGVLFWVGFAHSLPWMVSLFVDAG